jgi:porphobilinogen synthase
MAVTTQTRAAWSQLRLRQSAHIRDLIAETTFSVDQLIQPLFVVEDMTGSQPVPGLGDNARMGARETVEQVARDVDAGVRHFLLFPVPTGKRTQGLTFDHARRATEAIKQRFGDAVCLWVDICLCASTEHGHCAILDRDGRIDLEPTLDALSSMAVSVAGAGADGVSPSDMMDGRTARLRAALDERGYERVPVMSYSTKFASQFYGPFREAAGSAPQFGDRRHYLMDVRARRDRVKRPLRRRRRRPADGQAGDDVHRFDRTDYRGHGAVRGRVSGQRRVRGTACARGTRSREIRRRPSGDLVRVPPRGGDVHHHVWGETGEEDRALGAGH